jgi:hypothetical protein
MIKKEERGIVLISFAALLAIVFMLVIAGLSLSDVPTLVGQAVKKAVTKTTFLKATCSETDDGSDDWTKGVTSLKKSGKVIESKEDYCVDDYNQIEYYCEDNEIKEAEAMYCACDDGACIGYYYEKADTGLEVTPATEVQIQTEQTYKKKSTFATLDKTTDILTVAGCLDSDGGKTYDEQGTANDGTNAEADVCKSNGKLVEYYCDEDDVVQEEEVSCASGEMCSSGACVETGSCTDSESGFDLENAGTVEGIWFETTTAGEWTDACDEYSGKVKEYYCTDAGYAYYNMIACSSDDICNEGICIDGCSDTDESGTNKGYNIYTKGTTTGYWKTTGEEGSWTDYCRSDGVLMEYTCTTGYAYSSGKKCSDLGKTCSDGACV